jgi:hypothetical protein
MTRLKKVLIGLLLIFLLSIVSGYFYFDKKFTPAENSLTVQGSDETIPITWVATENSPISALLLPVEIENIPQRFYMQLDFGSPTTIFYSNPLASIKNKFSGTTLPDSASRIRLQFALGEMTVSSEKFTVINYGKSVNWDDSEVKNIIGTIGTDLLEKRITILNFKEGRISFQERMPGLTAQHQFSNFKFNKRRILLPAKIENEDVWLLYDSGTSAFELITSKENWDLYSQPNAEVKISKGNSWGNTLSVFTAPCNKNISFADTNFKLSEVTYISGTSFIQNTLMRFSGMEGTIGNKLFLKSTVVLDCSNQRFTVY